MNELLVSSQEALSDCVDHNGGDVRRAHGEKGGDGIGNGLEAHYIWQIELCANEQLLNRVCVGVIAQKVDDGAGELGTGRRLHFEAAENEYASATHKFDRKFTDFRDALRRFRLRLPCRSHLQRMRRAHAVLRAMFRDRAMRDLRQK